jgi:hypothetical protein
MSPRYSVFLSQPTAVAGLIKTAIEETAAATLSPDSPPPLVLRVPPGAEHKVLCDCVAHRRGDRLGVDPGGVH